MKKTAREYVISVYLKLPKFGRFVRRDMGRAARRDEGPWGRREYGQAGFIPLGTGPFGWLQSGFALHLFSFLRLLRPSVIRCFACACFRAASCWFCCLS